MKYSELKENLLQLFDKDKLELNAGDWGFFNEEEKEIKVIGYATSISPEIIEHSKEKGIDLLLTHHDSWTFVYGLKERCNQLLLESNITHAFFHAVLDDADFGTNASLGGLLCLNECRKTIPYMNSCYAGLVGYLKENLLFDDFSALLSGILQEPIKQFRNNDRPVYKVCISTGGGNMTHAMKYAVGAGCDTYVTGEYSLYSQQYAELAGMNLFVGSHTHTEIFGVRSMAEKLVSGTDLKIVRIEEPGY